MKIADGPVTLERNGHGKRKGYVRWRDYHHSYSSGQAVCYVHQLVAIAAGAEPEKVFSDGEYVTHHIAEDPALNYEENLMLVDTETHTRHHLAESDPELQDATDHSDREVVMP